MDNAIITAALAYAARGWAVFPLHSAHNGGCSCGRADCDRVAKHPRTPNGLKDATKDAEKIKAWWGQWPDAGIGIETGIVSGLVVLDIDGEVGRASAKSADLPISPMVETGRGLHVYFAHPGGVVKNQQIGGWLSKKYPGLDLRGDGGYVVAPPSVHMSGRIYSWHPELRFDTTQPAPLPAWLCAGADLEPKGPAPPLPDKIPQGQRYPRLVSLAGSLRRRGADAAEILAALEAVNSARCMPPYGVAKLRDIANDIAVRYQPAAQVVGAPGGGDEAPDGVWEVGPDGYALTDLGNAERLAGAHGGELRHVMAWGKWLVWGGARWSKDETGEVYRKFAGVIRSLYARAQDISETNEKKRWVGFLARSESQGKMAAGVGLAASLKPLAITHDIFDFDPWALNCLNGVLDLRSGAIRGHSPSDHMTKLANAEYQPTASAPIWEAFLERIMPDPDTRAFLKRAVGYSLTGDVSEQVLFFLWGRGANGKSTMLNALLSVFGEYGIRGAPGVISTRPVGEQHPAGRADLMGARMVVMPEIENGEKMAESLVKDLTGGDRIKARFMRQDFFEFEPTFKIWLAANHKPNVSGGDYAVWRRILLIPFEVVIPDGERDRDLLKKLKAEASGILRWGVEGCLEWRRDGLGVPAGVKAATESYRAASDALGEWQEVNCEVSTDAISEFGDLYANYCAWAEGAKERPMARRTFGLALEERGFPLVRTARARMRRGVRLAGLPTIADCVNGGGRKNDDLTDLRGGGYYPHSARARKGVTGNDMLSSADSDSSVTTEPSHVEWFCVTVPSFVGLSAESQVFRGLRGESGHFFVGDPVPPGVPEANLAALRARGAITRHPPPPEAATCPRCGSSWSWGGVQGWVWTCCGRPAP